MPLGPEGTDLETVRIRLLGRFAEFDEREDHTWIFLSGRRAFETGTGARITIGYEGGVLQTVRLDRPLYGNDQLYIAAHDRRLFISDFFGAVLAWLPVERRSISDEHLIDYLLFRTVPGTGTLITGIRRVGQGEAAEWRRGHGWSHTVQQFSLAEAGESHGASDILNRLDVALVASMAKDTGSGVNLFSGGVDSTLLQYYLGRATPTVTAIIDSPEFQPELEYARAARQLVGAQGREIAYTETEYRSRLEDTIRALRLPPHHLQTVSIDAGFSSPDDCYYTAQFADALFGLGFAGHAQRSWRWRTISPVGALGAALPGVAGRKLRTLHRTVTSLRTPAVARDSYAQTFAIYSDPAALRRIFGQTTVDARIRARSDYTLERLGPAWHLERTGLQANLELGHWIDFLCDDTVAVWGQLALARGKRLVAPFTHPNVVNASISIPTEIRYARRGVEKHWLKQLLLHKVPSYPIRQPKYSSGLPFWRYYRTGPLAHALRDYSRPSFLPAREWEALDDKPTWLTWNVLTLLMWDTCRLDGASDTPHGPVNLLYPSGAPATA